MRIKTILDSIALAVTSAQRKLLLAVITPTVLIFGSTAFAVGPYPEGEPGSASHPTLEPSEGGQSSSGGSSAASAGGLFTVKELWVNNGELRFVLNTCDRYFRMAGNDADRANAHDMLLSALLSNKKVTVFSPSLAPLTACPTTNAMAGSVRVQP
jgi:hypothetical protein